MDRLKQFIRNGKAVTMTPPAFDTTGNGSEASASGLSAAQVTPTIVAGTMAGPGNDDYAPIRPMVSTSTLDPEAFKAEMASQKSPTTIHQQLEQLVAHEREEATSQANCGLSSYKGLPPQFELIKKLGDGTFAEVYKALDRSNGSHVAIKIVRKRAAEQESKLDPTLREHNRASEIDAILKEVNIMRSLKHSSIVQLLSFTESEEHCFIVLELVNGGELFEQIVKLTYLSEALSRHVILQVAHGIRFMHEECGIVHRDIKPENLLFEAIDMIPSKTPIRRPYDDEKMDEGEFRHGVGGGGIGRVKIADFGLSKIVWEKNTKTPCGTVGYAAPEIVRDEQYSKSVDMWALGCVLYTVLCGFPPFYDESIKTLTEKVSKGQYTFLSPWWDDISDSAKDLVSNLLTVDVEKRFTIDQFLAHEWCQQTTAPEKILTDILPTSIEKLQTKSQSSSGVSDMHVDEPRNKSSESNNGGLATRSHNAQRMREAFDISSAANRIEEENQRRMSMSPEGKRDLAWRPLNRGPDYDRGAESVNKYRRGNNININGFGERRQAPNPRESRSKAAGAKPFKLDLEGATILERRKKAIKREIPADRAAKENLPGQADSLLPVPSGLA
ncbi:MAPK-activated protein kinase Srk1 [Malassezia yamatoensis]|uniref:MAPK-activated protein kinase Srk1 n=1 Tax=Malassezia yamatoensis TaxID=253288 RepID=A0AAJ5YR46_9BASI|nr:MAPK-activated protein kinase Srk1 [Malassezia yamatoensis]